MTDRIKGKPGGPFEGLEFVVAYIGCDNCVARSAGCRIPCLQAVPDPTISGNWIKPAPAQQDAPPTVPGNYQVLFPSGVVKVVLITERDIMAKAIWIEFDIDWLVFPFSILRFDGPITPPARWTDAHAPDCAIALNGRHACSCVDNAGAVPRRGSDVGTSPLLAISGSGDK
jgi:hypothetical protein